MIHTAHSTPERITLQPTGGENHFFENPLGGFSFLFVGHHKRIPPDCCKVLFSPRFNDPGSDYYLPDTLLNQNLPPGQLFFEARSLISKEVRAAARRLQPHVTGEVFTTAASR
jgi:hypothetical protein